MWVFVTVYGAWINYVMESITDGWLWLQLTHTAHTHTHICMHLMIICFWVCANHRIWITIYVCHHIRLLHLIIERFTAWKAFHFNEKWRMSTNAKYRVFFRVCRKNLYLKWQNGRAAFGIWLVNIWQSWQIECHLLWLMLTIDR